MPFTQKYKIYRYDGDSRGLLKPGALLRYSQQIAGEHAVSIRITDDLYARTHTAYVLAKLALHFDRVPHVDETLTVTTEPEKLKRAVNRRFNIFYDGEGREVACVDSRWVLIDTDRRLILRRHPPEFPSSGWAEELPRELPMKMTKVPLDQCELLGAHRADYSRCDMNGHLNNTIYADLICDALPQQTWQTMAVRDLVIYYHKEVPQGESLRLARAQLAENRWYFSDWNGETCNFEAEITLAPL